LFALPGNASKLAAKQGRSATQRLQLFTAVPQLNYLLSKSTMDPTLANLALDLALEWGQHFMQPTQPRLAKLHPELSAQQLDDYDAAARSVMKLAFDHVAGSPSCERSQLAGIVRGQFPWVSDANLARLHSQGQYYAMK
jgi:hypothetical protein